MTTSADLKSIDVATVVFRLYVAGEAPHSILALHNLQAICKNYCSGNFRIDVVDVLLSPERAWTDGVIVTPTLVRMSPEPKVQIIGDLADTRQVLSALGLGFDQHG